MNTNIRDKAILSLASAMVSLSVFSQSTDQNYLMETTMLDANSNNKMTSVQYYNGLGYPTVSVSTTGDGGQTTYSLVTYDGLGRESRKYVPVSTDNSILYKASGTIVTSYNDNTPYSQTLYALDRPISVTTPGATFASKPTRMAYHGVGSCDHFSDIMVSVLCFAKRHSRALVIIFRISWWRFFALQSGIAERL